MNEPPLLGPPPRYPGAGARLWLERCPPLRAIFLEGLHPQDMATLVDYGNLLYALVLDRDAPPPPLVEASHRARLRAALWDLEVSYSYLLDVYDAYLEERPTCPADAHMMAFLLPGLGALGAFIDQIRGGLGPPPATTWCPPFSGPPEVSEAPCRRAAGGS